MEDARQRHKEIPKCIYLVSYCTMPLHSLLYSGNLTDSKSGIEAENLIICFNRKQEAETLVEVYGVLFTGFN
jgi:hypothetical protein